ncbi:C1 family peptidase, partial [Salmonella sp. s51228]|uniref:C1 family peptidase n=1 Tax=Salmonella sp. s51228 TaxID=3159652 RepID=UPI00397F2339
WALKNKQLVSLSAEMLIDCDGTSDVINSRADCGVFGGWPYLAYQYIKQVGGIESEDTYPYCSGTGACYPCVPDNYNKSLCGPPPLYCNKTNS